MTSRPRPHSVPLLLVPFLLQLLCLAGPARAGTADCDVDGFENQPARHLIRGTIAPGVDDDTLLARAMVTHDSNFDSTPVEGGVTLRILDANGDTLREDIIAPSSWEHKSDRNGFLYVYRRAAGADPGAPGLLNMEVRYRAHGNFLGRMRIRAQYVNADIAALEGQGELSLEAGIGNETVGYCLKTRSLGCRHDGGNFVCD